MKFTLFSMFIYVFIILFVNFITKLTTFIAVLFNKYSPFTFNQVEAALFQFGRNEFSNQECNEIDQLGARAHSSLNTVKDC